MAKRRKSHKRRRARRIGAFRMGGKDTGLKLLAVGAGFLLGGTVNGVIDKMLPKTTDTVPVPTKNAEMAATVGQIGIGGLLLLMKKPTGTAGMLTKLAAGLLAGAGVKRAVKVMGIMSGYQNTPVIGRHRMAGYQSTPVLGAIPAQLAGRTPPQLSGYKSAGSGVGAYVNAGSGVMGSIGCCEGGSGVTHNTGSGYMN